MRLIASNNTKLQVRLIIRNCGLQNHVASMNLGCLLIPYYLTAFCILKIVKVYLHAQFYSTKESSKNSEIIQTEL